MDHELIARSSDAVVVLENGCHCCAVKADLIFRHHRHDAGRSGSCIASRGSIDGPVPAAAAVS
jgi:hypothetical protein